MKRVLSFFFVCMIILCSSPAALAVDDVSDDITQRGDAGVDLEPGVTDENGWYTSGSLYVSGSIPGYNFIGGMVVSGSKLWILYDSAASDPSYVVYDQLSTDVNCSSYTYEENNVQKYNYSGNYNSLASKWNIPQSMMTGYNTNLPIFNSLDEAQLYLASGDISGAVNADDITPEPPVEIPAPTNVKITSGFYDGSRKENVWSFENPVGVTWDSNVNEADLGFDVWCEFEFRLSFYELSDGKALNKVKDTVYSDWSAYNTMSWDDEKLTSYGVTYTSDKLEGVRDDFMTSELYYTFIKDVASSLLTGNLATAGNTIKASAITGITALDYYLANHKFMFRVRNTDNNGHYSDWVYVNLNYDTNETEAFTSDADDAQDGDEVGYETDGRLDPDDGSDSSVTKDGNITITIDNSNHVENNNNDTIDQIINGSGDGSGNGIDWKFTDLLKFIKMGFGLLGDNGFIALLSKLFSFLPAEIFTILTLAVTVAVVVMIINMVKRLFR